MAFRNPISNLIVPSGASFGDARFVIGPELPAPLNTYSPSTQFGPGSFYAGAIIWYALGDDTTYVYAAIVGKTGVPSVAGVVFGHVTNGSMGEIGAPGSGDPTGIIWRSDTGSFQKVNINSTSSRINGQGGLDLLSGNGNLTLTANAAQLIASAHDMSATATAAWTAAAATWSATATGTWAATAPVLTLQSTALASKLSIADSGGIDLICNSGSIDITNNAVSADINVAAARRIITNSVGDTILSRNSAIRVSIESGRVAVEGVPLVTEAGAHDQNNVNFLRGNQGTVTGGPTASGSFTIGITFPDAFEGGITPHCTANINNGSGSTSGWQCRCINITNTGMTIFGFGASSTFSFQITWAAVAEVV